MIQKLAVFLVILFASTMAYSQTQVYELPIYFGQYFNDPQLNTTGFGAETDITTTLGHRRSSNNFGGISTTLFSGQYKMTTKKENAFHTVGINFLSDKEGFLIRRNRAALTYGRHIKVSDKYFVAGGFALGFYNFSVVSNDVTGGLSNYALDGSVSANIYSEKSQLGLSMNQVSNAAIQPLEQEIILGRHLNIMASHQFTISEDFKLIPSAVARFSKKDQPVFSGFAGTLGLRALFQNKIMGGLSQEKSNGMYFFLGIQDINISNSQLDIDFSYFIPNQGSERSNVQLFEIMLGYDVNLKKKTE